MIECNIKRLLDLVLSAIAIVVLSPLLLPVIVVLRFTGEGEVFFSQARVGLDKTAINILKFATMLKNSPNVGTGTVTLQNDPRVLPIGKFLRRTKINELPQLFNIFKGDLSIIGPRPQTQRCFNAFQIETQNRIITVKPGLSGIGSIFFRHEEEIMGHQVNPNEFYNEVIMRFKGDLEMWYVSKQTLSVDFKLIFLTGWVVFGGDVKLAYLLFSDLPPIPENLSHYFE